MGSAGRGMPGGVGTRQGSSFSSAAGSSDGGGWASTTVSIVDRLVLGSDIFVLASRASSWVYILVKDAAVFGWFYWK